MKKALVCYEFPPPPITLSRIQPSKTQTGPPAPRSTPPPSSHRKTSRTPPRQRIPATFLPSLHPLPPTPTDPHPAPPSHSTRTPARYTTATSDPAAARNASWHAGHMVASVRTSWLVADSHCSRAALRSHGVRSLERTQPQRHWVRSLVHIFLLWVFGGVGVGGLVLSFLGDLLGCGVAVGFESGGVGR